MKLDQQIDEIYMLRERKQGLENQIKEVNAELNEKLNALLVRLDEVGTEYARGALASASVTETVVPKIEDWGEVAAWVMENDGVYLLHRRVSSGPWRELLDAGEEVPGIVPFTKRAISLRKLSD